MKELAHISLGESKFEPKLLELLEGSGLEKDDFEDLDWFSLLPFFALAGASVETEVHSHGDHFHFQGVRLTIPEALEEGFYDALPEIFAQLQGPEDAA